jgi:hypothetical protein
MSLCGFGCDQIRRRIWFSLLIWIRCHIFSVDVYIKIKCLIRTLGVALKRCSIIIFTSTGSGSESSRACWSRSSEMMRFHGNRRLDPPHQLFLMWRLPEVAVILRLHREGEHLGVHHPQQALSYFLSADPNNTDNNGFQNEDLIVWMRTAALPNFRCVGHFKYCGVNRTLSETQFSEVSMSL